MAELIRKKFKILKRKLDIFTLKSPRILFLKLINFVIIIVMVSRINFIHIVFHNYYVAFVKQNEKPLEIKKNQTRGTMYDRYGKPIVSNESVTSIVYHYDALKSADQIYYQASELAKIITLDMNKLSPYQLKDLYLYLYPQTLREEITDEDLLTLTKAEKNIQSIYQKMAEAFYGGENTIKFDATASEIAQLIEKIDEFPGVEVVTQARRHVIADNGVADIVGRVSSGDSSSLTVDFGEYLKKGYSINEQIGLSNLEYQYEYLLRGYKARFQSVSKGIEEKVYDGSHGADLHLTIDLEFSEIIDNIMEQHMKNAKLTRSGARYLQEGYVVVVDPSTGDVLSLNGKKLTDDLLFLDHPLGTMHNAFTMGSVVKGASLMTTYSHNITKYGDTILDKPMIFSDGSKKSSWKDLGIIDDISALRSSSNVYFMQQAILMSGDRYEPEKKLQLRLDTIHDYRKIFADFGLGTYTGIDLPSEQIGLKNTDSSFANLLDYVIGQSDTYTTLQLAQYVSTIANGGNRYALSILKDASITVGDEYEYIVSSHEPRLLNQIQLDEQAFNRVKEGFRQALQTFDGTGYAYFGGANYQPAGKTGTAEEYARDTDGYYLTTNRNQLIPTNHLTFVGFAPFKDPEIAIAVVFPQAELPEDRNPIALEVSREIMNAYFELQRTRARMKDL